MNLLIKNGKLFSKGCFQTCDILIEEGTLVKIGDNIQSTAEIFDAKDMVIAHGFIDMHTHLREPGYTHKETIKTGTLAAARGGYTTVCAMPNTRPVPDSVEHATQIQALIAQDAVVNVLLYGAITQGEKGKELADIRGLALFCVGFSDDGKGVQSTALMETAMGLVKAEKRFITAHCEDESLLFGGCIHEGEFSRKTGLKGISSASESEQVKRDIELVRKTGCAYHVCHISAKESLDHVRGAKAEGLPVTCEVTPHHAVLCDLDMEPNGNFKMNPPLRGLDDLQAIHRALADGTIDVIATDHAPHTEDEKNLGLENSLFGIVGLETAFGLLYENLVEKNIISAERLFELFTVNPAKILGIEGELTVGEVANLVVLDLGSHWYVDKGSFLSMGRNTPFHSFQVKGLPVLTIAKGKIAWENSI